jgi:gamma-glutamyl-gamma-aminobutyrate hydrolase PuuD
MRKAILIILLAGLASCTTKEKQWSQAEINAKVDSAVSVRTADMHKQAMEDLDSRLAIEVKAKADSIIQAHESQHAKDSLVGKKK